MGQKPLLPWYVFMGLLMGHFVVAGMAYVGTALKLQPGLKQAVILASAPESLPRESEQLTVQLQAATALPPAGVPITVEILSGSQYLELAEDTVTLSQESPELPLVFTITNRPQGQAELVELQITTRSEQARIQPSEPLVVRIEPEPKKTSKPVRLLVQVPDEVPLTQSSFQVHLEAVDLPAGGVAGGAVDASGRAICEPAG